MTHYINYYNDQIGGGVGYTRGVSNVFVGSRYQRGAGIGGFLKGLFRAVLPYIKSGARFIGKEAFRTGISVIDDIENKGINFKDAIKDRSKESLNHLKRKATEKMVGMMHGRGYKAATKKRKRQSSKKRAPARKKKRKTTKQKAKTKKNKSRKKTSKNSKKKKIYKKKVSKNKSRSINDIFSAQ